MQNQGVGVIGQSQNDMATHSSNDARKRERVRWYARFVAWTILVVSLLLICIAAVYLRGTTLGLATAFAESLIIYECILVLKKAHASQQ